MNIQEVEKHVKFDLIFTLLIFIGVGLCFLLSIVFIFKPTSVKAKEITNTLNISAKSYMPCGQTSSNGKYCAYTMEPTYTVRSTNTTYNGVLNGITFQFGDMLNAHAQYTMVIEAMSTDFRNNNLQVDVMASNQSDQLGTQISTYTWSYISKSKIQINFMQDNYNYHTVVLTGYPLTGVSTYGIKKVTLTYDDGLNDNSDIINSNTQNTTDIINNANSNTQDVINAINNGMTDLCTNLLEPFSTYARPGVTNFVPDVNGINASASSAWSYVQYRLPVENSKKYYFNGTFTTFHHLDLAIRLSYGDMSQYFYEFTPTAFPRQSWDYEFNSNVDGYVNVYLFITNESSNNAIFYEMMFSSKSKTFCPFGSNISKLDEQTKAIEKLQEIMNDLGFKTDETNAYLKDDTNPSVNTSEMNNVIGQVNIQDPLNYLLTLPINLLTKLNTVITSGSCSRASFGQLYGTELYLPCINFENYLGSSLWGTIDTIVGIGLLVIILKKFYDSISNILSLGKEEEVRKGMELPTPMEFLAQILGGGK